VKYLAVFIQHFDTVSVYGNNFSFQEAEGLHLVDKPLLKTISFDSMKSVKKLGMCQVVHEIVGSVAFNLLENNHLSVLGCLSLDVSSRNKIRLVLL